MSSSVRIPCSEDAGGSVSVGVPSAPIEDATGAAVSTQRLAVDL